MQTAGFVLVGGRSSRMGQHKALLPWRNQTLAEDVAKKVEAVAENVSLVGDPTIHGNGRFYCIADRRPGLGPLAGIEAALLSARGDVNLIVACDLPFLETDWLALLVHTAKTNKRKCVIASDKTGRAHPLCGVYRAECLEPVQRALDAGNLRMMDLVRELGAEHVSFAASIWNVNTPEDWKRCLEIANGR